MTTKNTQNEIFYSDGEGDDPLVSTGNDSDCCSDSHPPTGEGNNIQTPLLRGLLIPAEFEGWTDDEGFSIAKVSGSNGEGRDEAVVRSRPKVGDPALQSILFNLESDTSGEEVQDDFIDSDDGDEPQASGSREDESNEAVILSRPKIGEPSMWRNAINLGPDTSGEEGGVDQPVTPAHQVTDMFLFEELARMFIRSQIKLEMRVMTLERQLKERDQDVRIVSQELIKMRSQLAEAPGPPKVPQWAPRAQPRMGKIQNLSCHFCNFIFGSHDTKHCFRNPERVNRLTPSGRGRVRL